MLRKSHSTEWAGPSSERSESAIHTIALQQHFEEMKGDLRNFGDIFTQWVSSRRQALTTDKEEYLRTLAQEQDAVEGMRKQLTGLVARRQNVVAELQAEQREYDEGIKYNRELESQKSTLSRKLNEIREQVAKSKERLSQELSRILCNIDGDSNYLELETKEEEASLISKRESIETTLCQEKLGLFVEPISDNVNKFSFKYIDPANWERRFIIIMDTTSNRYRVQSCEPMLPHLSGLLDEVNESGDFYAFLRRVRAGFVDLATQK